MENTEEIFHILEDFSKRKPKNIPQELNDYLAYVARTGDPVYQWTLVKALFKEKLLNVITDFHETTPGLDIPPYPNVDPFNYDIMKNSLLERIDSFCSAPFTVQRICELLTFPRKQYNRIDKFMRAVEKNILVVSTREPGPQRLVEAENGEPAEPIANGSDNNSEYNVDVEMEDMSWKEGSENVQSTEPQPSSSESHITVDDIETRLQGKEDDSMETQEKIAAIYESVTPPELNSEESSQESNATETTDEITTSSNEGTNPPPTSKSDKMITENTSTEEQTDEVEMKTKEEQQTSVPKITVDDAEMTEQKLAEQKVEEVVSKDEEPRNIIIETETKSDVSIVAESQSVSTDESSSDSNCKDEVEIKQISEVSTSSEESSSSSDNTDGNSNSPKTEEIKPETVLTEIKKEELVTQELAEPSETQVQSAVEAVKEEVQQAIIETDKYTVSDLESVKSEPIVANIDIPDVKAIEEVSETIEEPLILKVEPLEDATTKPEELEIKTESTITDKKTEESE